jgi:hypothetical protein
MLHFNLYGSAYLNLCKYGYGTHINQLFSECSQHVHNLTTIVAAYDLSLKTCS